MAMENFLPITRIYIIACIMFFLEHLYLQYFETTARRHKRSTFGLYSAAVGL